MHLTHRQGSTADVVLVVSAGLLTGTAAAVAASPLLLPAAVVLGAACLWLLQRPDAALRVAVVAVLLPPGLLPPLAQSGLEAGSIGLAALATAIETRAAPRARPLGAAVWLLGAFVVWGLLTLAWSDRPDLGVDLLRRYVLGVLLLLLVVVRTTRREAVDGLMDALAFAAWTVVVCGVLAVLTGHRTSEGRLQVFDLNPNQLGNVLLLSTPGVLWRALAPGRATRARTLQAIVYLCSALLLIAQSGSRGSLLAFVLLVLGFTATRTLRRWGAVAAGLGIVLLLVAPALFGTVSDRIRHQDPTQLSRTTLWASGLSLIADHPFGVGLGHGLYVMPTYIDARVSLNHFANRDQYPAHNPLIEVGTDTGVVGMVLYGGALLAAAGTFMSTVRGARRRRDLTWLAYGATVGTCSVAFLSVWSKNGGEQYDYTTFILLALWLVHAAADGSAHPSGTQTWAVSSRAA